MFPSNAPYNQFNTNRGIRSFIADSLTDDEMEDTGIGLNQGETPYAFYLEIASTPRICSCEPSSGNSFGSIVDFSLHPLMVLLQATLHRHYQEKHAFMRFNIGFFRKAHSNLCRSKG